MFFTTFLFGFPYTFPWTRFPVLGGIFFQEGVGSFVLQYPMDIFCRNGRDFFSGKDCVPLPFNTPWTRFGFLGGGNFGKFSKCGFPSYKERTDVAVWQHGTQD
jgi:hypothetical protein